MIDGYLDIFKVYVPTMEEAEAEPGGTFWRRERLSWDLKDGQEFAGPVREGGKETTEARAVPHGALCHVCLCKFTLIKTNISFSVVQATFQVLSGHMWFGTATLDIAELDHIAAGRPAGLHWTVASVKTQAP